MRNVDTTPQFARDIDRIRKRGQNRSKLDVVVEHARVHGQMSRSCRPHKLSGEWDGYWECHVGFDWLLIYAIDDKKITLWRTGTHDDLFG